MSTTSSRQTPSSFVSNEGKRVKGSRSIREVSNKKYSRFGSTSKPPHHGSTPQDSVSTNTDAASARKLRTAQTRIPFTELQKREREISLKNDLLLAEKENLETQIKELTKELAAKNQTMRDLESTAHSLRNQENELFMAHQELSSQMDNYEKKMEDLGIDPVTLERFPIDQQHEHEMAAEIEEFAASLKALNAKLSLSHDTLQSNITRMTLVLSQLNTGASDFTEMLDEMDGDGYMDESYAESLNESFEPLSIDGSFL